MSVERFCRLGVLQGLVDDVPGEHREEFRALAMQYLDAKIERVSRPALRAIFGLILRQHYSERGACV
ncbi:hypothetical protein [Haladaptatus salinisoli]|uniref:hypothetical protein n=1 Tax=Haladaptatus salinisoli TaxID=2884876 RepID=UPI001D0BA617|nr:hypothetical protein [Haladaptatus salinisoli]